MNYRKTVVKWGRRVVSAIFMMSIFYAAFVGGLNIFLFQNLKFAALAFIWVALGLIISRLLWV